MTRLRAGYLSIVTVSSLDSDETYEFKRRIVVYAMSYTEAESAIGILAARDREEVIEIESITLVADCVCGPTGMEPS